MALLVVEIALLMVLAFLAGAVLVAAVARGARS